IKESSFAEKRSGVEVLNNLQNQSDFRQSINDLVHYFLESVSKRTGKEYSYIMVLLDDVDLVANSAVYATLQDMFKFLQYQSNIIVITDYRETQLINYVLDNLIEENEQLMKHQVIEIDELQKQAVNFIEKGLPRNQRVYLVINHQTTVYDVLKPFVDNENDLENYN